MRLPFSRNKQKTADPESPPATPPPKKGLFSRSAKKVPAGMAPCPKCKTPNPGNVNFCKACGSAYPGRVAAVGPAGGPAMPATPSASPDPKAWLERGNDFYRKGRYAEALECFTTALDIDPGYAKAWNNKALVLEKIGNATEARACRERFTQLTGQIKSI